VTDAPGEIRHMALYDLKSSDVINTDAWRSASDAGEWITRIRPHITGRSRAMYNSYFRKDRPSVRPDKVTHQRFANQERNRCHIKATMNGTSLADLVPN
jgi:hypothetical protein